MSSEVWVVLGIFAVALTFGGLSILLNKKLERQRREEKRSLRKAHKDRAAVFINALKVALKKEGIGFKQRSYYRRKGYLTTWGGSSRVRPCGVVLQLKPWDNSNELEISFGNAGVPIGTPGHMARAHFAIHNAITAELHQGSHIVPRRISLNEIEERGVESFAEFLVWDGLKRYEQMWKAAVIGREELALAYQDLARDEKILEERLGEMRVRIKLESKAQSA